MIIETERWPPLLTKALAAGGIIGPIQFFLVSTILGLLRPGYSPIDQAISDLGVGEKAWFLNASLIILGLLLIGLAIAFHRTVRPAESPVWRLAATLFITIVGLGYAAAGSFPETTPLHWLLGAIPIFVAAPFGFMFAGLLMARAESAWRSLSAYSLVSSLLTVVLVALTFYVFSFYQWTSGPAPIGRFGGLMERLLFVEILAWYVLIGWRLMRNADTKSH